MWISNLVCVRYHYSTDKFRNFILAYILTVHHVFWRHMFKALFDVICSTYVYTYSRAAKPIHCSQNVKTVRICTEFNKSINNISLICHILWHFQDGRPWPWEFYVGQKLKHAPIISLEIVSNCLSCHKDSKNV